MNFFFSLLSLSQFTEAVQGIIEKVDNFVWGPVMLVLLVGTGIFLTVRTRFLAWRNLGFSIKSVLSKESRSTEGGDGDVSPFACLMTALAGTIGTGNIVGVATAMVSGGPGALVWMWISAAFGITTKFSECMLASKYREVNDKGEMSGGPMYTMKNGFKHKKIGAFMGMLFAIFTVFASFGVGNVTQANSISDSLNHTFTIPTWLTGAAILILVLLIVIGGIKSISKVSQVVVPVMALVYAVCGIIIILVNIENLPSGIYNILNCAFNPHAVAGGVAGTITVSVMNAIRFGVARGVFSNEAGLGSAAITAAAAKTDHHVSQGYINSTGTFFDTIIICTITGLVIASTGILGITDANGELVKGAGLTIQAFRSTFGTIGEWMVSISIAFFAFSTILGWEYQGEKAIEYIFKTSKFNIVYRLIFALITFIGATTTLQIAWSFSDIANALMAIPNLICLLALSGVVAKDIREYQPTIEALKRKKS